MLKNVVLIVLAVIALFCVSQLRAIEEPSTGTELTTPQNYWKTVGTFLSASGDPVDLIKSERTYLIVTGLIETAADDEDKIVIKQLDYGVNALRFRLTGLTEGDVIVLQLYGGALSSRLNCELVKRGTLTFTIGGQVSIDAGIELADTCVVTNTGANTSDVFVVSPADDTCAEVLIDWQGDDVVCIIPTSIPCNSQLFMKDY